MILSESSFSERTSEELQRAKEARKREKNNLFNIAKTANTPKEQGEAEPPLVLFYGSYVKYFSKIGQSASAIEKNPRSFG